MNRPFRYLALSIMACLFLADSDRERKPDYLDPAELTPPSAAYIEADDDSAKSCIERELRKWPAWVNDIVNKRGGASLWLMIGDSAFSYTGHMNAIGIPEDAYTGSGSMSSLSHELTHFIHDNEGSPGLIFSGHYSGPAWEEIESAMEKRLSFPDTILMKDRVLRYLEDVENGVDRITVGLSRMKVLNDGIRKATSEYEMHIREVDGLDMAGPGMEELEGIKRTYDERRGSMASLEKQKEELMDRLTPVLDDAGELSKKGFLDCSEEEVTGFSARAYEMISELGSMSNSYRSALADFRRLRDSLIGLEERACMEKASRCRRDGDADSAVVYEGRAYRIGLSRKVNPVLEGPIENLPVFSLEYKNAVNDAKTREMFSTTEQFARVVSSLMCVHVGSYTLHQFKLTEEELDMLSRMMFRGEPIFGHAVEKYRLAMEMEKEGHDPDRIREALEFATSFEYRGIQFEWPHNGFDIDGAIPRVRRSDIKGR